MSGVSLKGRSEISSGVRVTLNRIAHLGTANGPKADEPEHPISISIIQRLLNYLSKSVPGTFIQMSNESRVTGGWKVAWREGEATCCTFDLFCILENCLPHSWGYVHNDI